MFRYMVIVCQGHTLYLVSHNRYFRYTLYLHADNSSFISYTNKYNKLGLFDFVLKMISYTELLPFIFIIIIGTIIFIISILLSSTSL